MAWIESHQSLAGHPKTKRLARELGVSLPTAIGHLHLLWWWTLEYAEDGNLERYKAEDIADACLWDKEASVLWKGLVAAGFIDDVDGNGKVHDWQDYAGKLVERRRYNRERMKQQRATHVQRTLSERSKEVVRYRTVPNHTVPNRTEEKGSAEGKQPLWTPPEWFVPLTSLSGYKATNHEKAAKGIEAACVESGAAVADVVAGFAREWPTLKIKYRWRDPVGTLKGEPLRIAIEKSLNGATPNGKARLGATQCPKEPPITYHTTPFVDGKPILGK